MEPYMPIKNRTGAQIEVDGQCTVAHGKGKRNDTLNELVLQWARNKNQ